MLNGKKITFNLIAFLFSASNFCANFIYNDYQIYCNEKMPKEERNLIINFIKLIKFQDQSSTIRKKAGLDLGQANLEDPFSISMVVGQFYPVTWASSQILESYLASTNRYNQTKSPKTIYLRSTKNLANKFELAITKVNTRNKKKQTENPLLSLKYWRLDLEIEHKNIGSYFYIDKPEKKKPYASIILPKLTYNSEPIALENKDIEEFFESLSRDATLPQEALTKNDIDDFCSNLGKQIESLNITSTPK